MANSLSTNVIPLQKNSLQAAARARRAVQRSEATGRHPSLLAASGERASAAQIAAVVAEIDQTRATANAARSGDDSPTGLARRIAAVADFVEKRMAGDYTVDEFGFDPHLNTAVFMPMLRGLFTSWFRVEVHGIENLPVTGPALVVANHAGVLPIDGLMAAVAVGVAKCRCDLRGSDQPSRNNWGVAHSYRPVHRDQAFLLPPDMADWLPDKHLVWFVLDVVAQLDTAAFHATRKTGGVGRQGYDPDMLLALMIYAYSVGERSSRRIERLCVEHVAFRILCGQDVPDHTTIARFRSAYHDAFADLFAQVLRLCADAGMVKVGVISIDGTKIVANGSMSANRSHEWLAKQARRIAGDIVADADATDAAEDAAEADNGRVGQLPEQFATRKGRAANIKKALEELERQDEADTKETGADRERIEEYLAKVEAGEPSLRRAPAGTDPIRLNEIRIRREQRRIASVEGVRGAQASTVRHEAKRSLTKYQQALADARQQVASGQFDERTRSVRLRDERRARARLRGSRGPVVNVTDPESRLMTEGSGGGSVQGYNAQVAVSDDHLVIGVYVSQDANDFNCWKPTLTAAQTQLTLLGKTIGLALADTGYFTEENVTPGGPDKLIAPGKGREVIRDAKSNPTDGPPPEDLEPLEAMRHRMRQPENAERYKRRSATVEPVIGHLKDQTGLRRFSRRGLTAAIAELHFAAAVLNLTKLRTHTPATA